MTMTFAHAARIFAAALVAAASALPAAAQKTAPAPTPAPAPPVSAWTVAADEARGVVTLTAQAKGGTVQFTGGCSRSGEPGMVGRFSGYHGNGLRTDGEVEHVAFYARGEDWQDAFAVRLRYSPADRSWQFARPLAPVFLSSFSRGATLAVVNGRNQEIFTFDLTGSTAAVRAMRTVCGLE
jgi:hypothetical protein